VSAYKNYVQRMLELLLANHIDSHPQSYLCATLRETTEQGEDQHLGVIRRHVEHSHMMLSLKISTNGSYKSWVTFAYNHIDGEPYANLNTSVIEPYDEAMQDEFVQCVAESSTPTEGKWKSAAAWFERTAKEFFTDDERAKMPLHPDQLCDSA